MGRDDCPAAVPVVSMTWPQYRRGECSYWGAPIHLRPKEAELLLLYLLRRDTFVSRTDAIEFLWPNPDLEPDSALNCVTIYATALERKLPGVLTMNYTLGRIIDREAA